MPSRGPNESQVQERLGAEECWRALDSQALGRLCFCLDGRVQVSLTSYVVRAARIYFRTTAYGPVARHVRTRPVTLEVDDLGRDHEPTWAVTATGTAHRLDDAAALAALWTRVRPPQSGAGRTALWIELVPDEVSGERFGPRPPVPTGRPASS